MRLKVLRPCPTPALVTTGHCALCDKRVHDLTQVADPVAEASRIGQASFCAKVLVAALTLEGCSGALDGFKEPVSTPVVQQDAGLPDGVVVGDEPAYLGELYVDPH